MVAHDCNPCTWEVEGRESGVQGHFRTHREFEVSLGYTMPMDTGTQAWTRNSVGPGGRAGQAGLEIFRTIGGRTQSRSPQRVGTLELVRDSCGCISNIFFL